MQAGFYQPFRWRCKKPYTQIYKFTLPLKHKSGLGHSYMLQKNPARKHTNWERESKRKSFWACQNWSELRYIGNNEKDIISQFIDIKTLHYTSKPQYVLDVILRKHTPFEMNIYILHTTPQLYHTQRDYKKWAVDQKPVKAFSMSGIFDRQNDLWCKKMYKILSVNETRGENLCLHNSASYVGAYCVVEDFPT